MGKKYYLTDAELKSATGDFFNCNDYKKSIFKILENNEPPYNIAVIGKWGMGKSSLINMVKAELVDKQHYRVIQINAWKYEKEVLARVFLRQVFLNLGSEAKTTSEMFNEEIKECLSEKKGEKNEKETILKVICRLIKSNWIFFLAVFVVSVVLYAVYKYFALLLLEGGINHFKMHVFTGYCRNLGAVLILPVFLSLVAIGVERIKDKENSVGVTYPMPGVEDYEIMLNRKMKEHNDEKIVIILDDLDRLGKKKMMEALDAIKVFINYDNFIFIVPFDDQILKQTIRDEKVYDEDGFLDKLFQFKLYLPPLYEDNIKDYAWDICKRGLIDFIEEYCDGNADEIERIIRNILIHLDVETPRQVKKLVNAFVSNQMIAREREKSGKVEKGFASSAEGMRMIAKLSVLQADYNEFYDLLLLYPNAMELVVDANRDRGQLQKLPKEIRAYLNKDRRRDQGNVEGDIDKTMIPLINFLTYTSQYQVETIESYLYLVMDDIAVKTGSKMQREFLKMIQSKNMSGTLDLYKEMPELFETAVRLLKRTMDSSELKRIVCTFLYMLKELTPNHLTSAVEAISLRAGEFSTNMEEADENDIDYENLMYGYQVSEFSVEYMKLIEKCIKSENKAQAFQKLYAYMNHIEWFEGRILKHIEEHISWVLGNNLVTPKEFWEIKEHYKGAEKPWAESYYRYLVEHIIEQKNREQKMIEELPRAFVLCATKENAFELWNLLSEGFGDASLGKLFAAIVKADEHKMIPNEDIGVAIDQLIKDEACEIENVRELVLLRDYKPEDAESYCEFISAHSNTKAAADLIIAYCNLYGADDMQSAILVCVKEVLAKPEINCADNFERLVKFFEANTRTKIVSEFKTVTKYISGEPCEYINVGKQYGIFAREYWDNAEEVMEKMFAYVKGYNVTPTYAQLVVNYSIESFDCFDEVMKQSYLSVLKIFVKDKNLVEQGIYGLMNYPDEIPVEDFLEIEQVLSQVIDDRNCYDICKIYRTNQKYITEQNDNLGGYIEANLQVIENMLDSQRGIWALQNLNRKYQQINVSSFKRLFSAIEHIDAEVQRSGVIILSKFLGNYQPSDAIKLIVWMLKEENKEFADTVINNNSEYSTTQITDYILTNQSEFDVTDIVAVLHHIYKNFNTKIQHKMFELVAMAYEKSSETSERLEIIKFLELLNKRQRGKDDKNYQEILQKIYLNGDIDEQQAIKEKVAKKWKVSL